DYAVFACLCRGDAEPIAALGDGPPRLLAQVGWRITQELTELIRDALHPPAVEPVHPIVGQKECVAAPNRQSVGSHAPNPVHDGPQPQSSFPATIADQALNPARLEDPALARRGLAPYGRSCAESPQTSSDRLAGLQHVFGRPIVWASKRAPPQRCGTSRKTEIPHPEPVQIGRAHV